MTSHPSFQLPPRRPLLLSLLLSHSLPLFLFHSQTLTTDAPCTHLLNTDVHLFLSPSPFPSHDCTPPLICAAVNVCAISEVLNQLSDAEPVNGLGRCRPLQSLCMC
ncbi:hypothetical protein CHARACLAT_022133, partial [Characodon lateralis]|nr:hypothetical protein [Characodon lateralis]